ncbi:MAG: hypothetical protein ACSHXB_04005 [Sulfitobacter sp.]
MLNVYAQTFMTATRTDCVQVRDIPSVQNGKRLHWFKRGKARCIDLAKL